jgi:PAS domain S-box-containing protein/putative nucleotidyltransferase with HDIG domain
VPRGRKGASRKLTKRLREGESISQFETQCIRQDGSLVDVALTLFPIRNDTGNAVAISVMAHDITERKQAAEMLRQSEEKFVTAFRASPDSLTITRFSDGEILDANEGFERMFGYTRAESVGKTTVGLSIYTDPSGRDRLTARLRKDGQLTDFESTFRRKDGTVFTASFSARLLSIQGEECFVAVVRDITERKRAEEALRTSEATLSEAQRIGRIGSFEWDARTDATTWSDETYRLYGRDPKEKPPTYEERLKMCTPESAARLDAATKRSAQTDEPYVLDVEEVRPDGTRRWVTSRGEATRDTDGTVIGMHGTVQDITELKKAHEQAARLAAIVTSSPDAIVTKDLDEVITSWNPAAEALYGYAGEEIIGRGMEVLMPPGLEDEPKRLTENILKGEKVERFETQRRRKDGSLVDVALTLFPVRNDTGDILAISVMTHDITERKQVEQKRLRAEKFFQDTFEHADVGIAHVGMDGTWLRINPRLCDMLGYSRKELLATTFAAITHPDDVDENMTAFHRMLAGEQSSYDADKRYLRKDGSIVWVHVNIVLIRKEDGTPDYNLDVITDITKRKQAETALRESEEKFRDLFNNAEVGMFRTKLDGSELLDLNDKYLEILGYAREELINKPSVIVWADPREREAMMRTLEETGRVVDLEFDLLTKQGDVRRCLTSLKLYRDTGILEGSITDITERKRAEELAAQQAERIARTLTSAIDIAGNIVELRDPYTSGHQQRVSELAVRMAQSLGLSGHEIDDIRVAGLLHDMGKAGIPTEILSKPGMLSPIEFTLIKGHAEAGHRLAVSANMAEPIAEMIYQHHERADGSGYPRGLTGDQALLGSKVLAVADVVEAMMSHRPYRPALGIKEALAEIERGAGSLYDAWVVEACVRLFNEEGFEFSKS